MESDSECPICFVKYGEQEDGSFRCKDSIHNSDIPSDCKHYICSCCAATMYEHLEAQFTFETDGEAKCPLCRADWTDWLMCQYGDDYDDVEVEDEEDEDE